MTRRWRENTASSQGFKNALSANSTDQPKPYSYLVFINHYKENISFSLILQLSAINYLTHFTVNLSVSCQCNLYYSRKNQNTNLWRLKPLFQGGDYCHSSSVYPLYYSIDMHRQWASLLLPLPVLEKGWAYKSYSSLRDELCVYLFAFAVAFSSILISSCYVLSCPLFGKKIHIYMYYE